MHKNYGRVVCTQDFVTEIAMGKKVFAIETLVGVTATEAQESAKKADYIVRVRTKGDRGDMARIPGRVNLYVDENGKVTKATFG